MNDKFEIDTDGEKKLCWYQHDDVDIDVVYPPVKYDKISVN